MNERRAFVSRATSARNWLRLVVLLVGLGQLTACHFFRAPRADMPALSAGREAQSLHVQARDRRYVLYVPKRHDEHPPLVVLLHASRQTAESMRRVTGYAFERLAEQHGFIVVYPESHGRRWNDCRAAGRYRARRQNVDDVGFVLRLVDELVAKQRIDPARVFFVGYSSGAQLAFRIALERPERVAGIAAFSASLPTPESWSCNALGRPVPVLLMNGTHDRINPYQGGKVSVFGFASRGTVRSARASAEFFAELAGGSLVEHVSIVKGGQVAGERWRWYAPSAADVELLSVHGGGHVIPGPSSAFPRILGAVSRVIDGPREAWSFFARQLARAR